MNGEREPLGSNIYDAINHMRNEIENCEAVVNETPVFNQLAWLPAFMAAILMSPVFGILSVYVIMPGSFIASLVLIMGVMGFYSVNGFIASVVSTLVITFTWCGFLDSKKTKEYLGSKRKIKKLEPILADLERLYQYDQNMNVGFKLDGKGDFDEIVLKGVMKKREREIKQQARS
jgi:hypothetical protein